MTNVKNCLNIKIIRFNKNIKNNIYENLDLIIILDVFRASSTLYYLFSKNVKKVYPVSNIKMAIDLSKNIDNYVLIGENKGIKPRKFSYNNSPSEIVKSNLNNKNVIMSTSSGTKAILHYNCNNIIIGSLLNVDSIIEYISNNSFKNIGICVTNNIMEDDYNEDYICAQFIYSKLISREYDIFSKIKKLEEWKNNRFFKQELQNVFPKNDFYMCTSINRFNFVLKYNGEYIEKIK